MRIAVVTISPELLKSLGRAANRLTEQRPGWGAIELLSAIHPMTNADRQRLADMAASCDVIFVDLMGADPSWSATLAALLAGYGGWVIASGPFLANTGRLGRYQAKESQASAGMTQAGMRPGPMGGSMPPAIADPAPADPAAKDAAIYARIVEAMTRAQDADADFILAQLLALSGAEITVPEPSQEPAQLQFLDPTSGVRYDDLAEFTAAVGAPNGRPVIGLLFNGGSFPNDTQPVAAGLAEYLASIGWVLPIACNRRDEDLVAGLREIFQAAGYQPELLLSLRPFRFSAGPVGGDPSDGEEYLRELNVPYLRPLLAGRERLEDWRNSDQGLGAGHIVSTLLLPEMDGCRDEILVAATEPTEFPELPGAPVTDSYVLIPEQVDRLVQRAGGWLNLRRKANQDKRVAIIGYDYPNGEGNLLGGAQLDVAASIEVIMADLAEQGYLVDPPAPGDLLNTLLREAVNDPAYGAQQRAKLYPRAQAIADINAPSAWQQVEQYWADRDVQLPMTTPEGDFLIPAVEFGNVLVGVQPGRSPLHAGHDATHDNSVPPHPQYLAFYAWLREQWHADVIVHVGTHGTFEFLKSKQAAVSVRDFPDLMLGGTPHVYLYYVGNPSEGTAARRRSHAVLVSYQPPVLRPGGLHGELAQLHSLVHELREADQLGLASVEELTEQISELAAEAHLPTDPDALESELERLESGLVPYGLHVFGQPFSEDERFAMVCGLLSCGLADQPPAVELWAAANDIEDIAELSATARMELEGQVQELIGRALRQPELSTTELTSDEPLAQLIERGRQIANSWASNDEWAGLHAALNGQHLPSKLGGDMMRSPEVLPAGTNIHQFDPHAIPTSMAMRRGEQIAESIRQAHRQANDGAELRCAGIILWGIEATRTQGESYAQILALLGVRISGRARPGRNRWEVIPAAELSAPRVDVVVTISGFFRDLFGNLIEELDDIINALAELDEPEEINPIAARTRKLRAEFEASGMGVDEAAELAKIRIFGPSPGRYGPGLTATIDSGQWDDSADLSAGFIAGSEFAYTRRRYGQRIAGLFGSNLEDIEAVCQIRSNNEYQITDLDHFFEFLGGMSNAAKHLSGRQIPTLVSDTTGRKVHTGSSADAARAGLYTRLLNPAWTEAMLSHGHRGVSEINDRTTNLLGLSAMTSGIDDWMFDSVFDTYLGDEQMRRRLAEANPHATAAIAARLTEADRRGLWNASPDRRELLDHIQFDIDAELEGVDFSFTNEHSQVRS